MNLKCLIQKHDWNRSCKCSRCGKMRDTAHDFSADCEECRVCGKKCLVDAHTWIGCKCRSCQKTRDEGHDWSKNCGECSICRAGRSGAHEWRLDCEKCQRCGLTRAMGHKWMGCKCFECGKTRDRDHDWTGCKCTICGKVGDTGHVWAGCMCTVCGFDLANEMRDPSAGNCRENIEQLKKIASEEAVNILCVALNNEPKPWGPDESWLSNLAYKNAIELTAKLAADALGELRPIQSVRPLIQLLTNPENANSYSASAAAAARSLGLIGDASAIEPLKTAMLTYFYYKIRLAAAKALKQLGWSPATEDEAVGLAVAFQNWDEVVAYGSAATPYLKGIRKRFNLSEIEKALTDIENGNQPRPSTGQLTWQCRQCSLPLAEGNPHLLVVDPKSLCTTCRDYKEETSKELKVLKATQRLCVACIDKGAILPTLLRNAGFINGWLIDSNQVQRDAAKGEVCANCMRFQEEFVFAALNDQTQIYEWLWICLDCLSKWRFAPEKLPASRAKMPKAH